MKEKRLLQKLVKIYKLSEEFDADEEKDSEIQGKLSKELKKKSKKTNLEFDVEKGLVKLKLVD